MNSTGRDLGQGHRTLVAGVGNIFLGDDGFGVEVVRRLASQPLPDDVEVVDSGVRGVHLAYQLLDGYETAVLVDATSRGAAPGTIHLIDASARPPRGDAPAPVAPDGHHMTPDAVLALLETLRNSAGGTGPRRVLVVGCEPASVEEGIGLSEPVAAVVDEAVRCVLSVVRDEACHACPEGISEP
ncbi:hydrogenase maturation protease [Streptomyces sp. RB6PN25]|uniref:Hydrogenase maturation protease n=1 Tax=Streptomyces humicola TaxID=2953240 RepID=A0ABT1PS09_9ACTN|nr:hydrogenase maturation protease [Streptomyces humicola]MCQ4079342.1 hydrogenase maturation protease [Streptomyces humicola]